MSLLLLFSGAGDEGWSPPKKDSMPRVNYQLERLNREDEEILTVIIAWVLNDG
jgi:hypothetical protein